jgi:hypothetical protein
MTFTEILTETRRLTKTNSNTYPTSEITNSANRSLDREVALIRQSEGRWQWDDSNNTDYPEATTAISDGVNNYTLDPTHYRIERVEVKDTNGIWTRLIPFDEKDVPGSLTEFRDEEGTPRYYDKKGNSLLLTPTPDYSQGASLKVIYQRGPSYFTASDTTKTPGFNTLFHQLVPLWCAYDYALINQMDIRADLEKEIYKMEAQLIDYYSLRDKDEHIRLTKAGANYSFK